MFLTGETKQKVEIEHRNEKLESEVKTARADTRWNKKPRVFCYFCVDTGKQKVNMSPDYKRFPSALNYILYGVQSPQTSLVQQTTDVDYFLPIPGVVFWRHCWSALVLREPYSSIDNVSIQFHETVHY